MKLLQPDDHTDAVKDVGMQLHLVNINTYLQCELNYHDQKIWWILMHNIWKYWTAVSTLLGLISSEPVIQFTI